MTALAVVRLLVAVGFGLLLPGVAVAGDGALQWRTLQTADADIHFPAQYLQFAQRVAATMADARRAIAPSFNPRDHPKLQLTIDDFGDDANGYAQTVPYDHVHLQAYPPQPGSDLGDHGDWIRQLVFHEYAHILHLGDVSGLPALANRVVGRQVLPNTALPRLMTEGIATWLETRHTGGDTAVAGQGGRVDSTQFMAYIRAAVRDDTLPKSLSELTGAPLQWPRGNSWYIYGSLFIDDLVQRFGEAKLKEFMAEYGKLVVPYAMNSVARQVWGAPLEALWRQARARTVARVQAQWREMAGDVTVGQAEAQLEGTRLTFDGGWRGRIRPMGDHFAVVAHAPNDGLRRIEQIDLLTGAVAVLHWCPLDCDEPLVSADQKWLLFTETRRTHRLFNYREVLAKPLNGDVNAPVQQLTHGLRVRAIALQADAPQAWLVGVGVQTGQTALFALRWRQLIAPQAPLAAGPRLAWLTPFAPLGTVLDAPVLAEGTLYWTVGAGSQRWVRRAPFDRGSGALGHPVADPAADGPDGRIWDLYATTGNCADAPQPALSAIVARGNRTDLVQWLAGQPVATTALVRARSLTGIASAALGPGCPGGAMMVRHGGAGMDVWRAPSTAVAVDLPLAPTQLAQPYAPPGAEQGLVSDYQPLASLAPRYWRPIALATGDGGALQPGGLWLGAQLFGRDAVGWMDAMLLGQIRTDGTDPTVQGELSIDRFEPSWALSAAYDHSSAFFRRGYFWHATPIARTGVRFGGSWSLPGLREAWQFTGGLRWRYLWLREPNYDLQVPQDPAGPPPVNPTVGHDALVDLGLGWRYSERYPDSIRTERTHAFGLGAISGARLAGDGQRAIVTGYTDHAWPLGRRRVLAISANFAAAPVPGQRDPLYGITGIHPLQALSVLGLGGPGSYAVRGAPWDGSGLGGNGLLWGWVAWHTPLRDIGRSLDVLPVWVGRCHGSVFGDGALAWWPAGKLKAGWMASLGAEAILDLTFGYRIDAALHLGVAWTTTGDRATWLSLGL